MIAIYTYKVRNSISKQCNYLDRRLLNLNIVRIRSITLDRSLYLNVCLETKYSAFFVFCITLTTF